ncbi:MAG: MotA/TolQ/ExbB proton channel family protein [Bacillota bacterium]
MTAAFSICAFPEAGIRGSFVKKEEFDLLFVISAKLGAIRIDPTTLLGIIAALAFVVLSFILKDGHLSSLIVPAAMAVVFGCTLSASIATLRKVDIPDVFRSLRMLVQQRAKSPTEMIEEIVSLAEKARREGLLYLENYLEGVEDPFLRKGLQLVIDGAEPEVVKGVLETELYALEERHRVAHEFFETAGAFAPTMGIAGAILGLIVALGNIQEPDKLGPAIASAFVATLYGVVFAYLICFPIATKLKTLTSKEVMLRLLVQEGVIALQSGNNPIIIRERLNAFLNPNTRTSSKKSVEEETSEAAG